jgi:hypothetical protein
MWDRQYDKSRLAEKVREASRKTGLEGLDVGGDLTGFNDPPPDTSGIARATSSTPRPGRTVNGDVVIVVDNGQIVDDPNGPPARPPRG